MGKGTVFGALNAIQNQLDIARQKCQDEEEKKQNLIEQVKRSKEAGWAFARHIFFEDERLRDDNALYECFETFDAKEVFEMPCHEAQKMYDKWCAGQTAKKARMEADEIVSVLSGLRSRYNCFNQEDEEYYRGLSEAIRVIKEKTNGTSD